MGALIAGVVLVIAGGWARFWVGRREFRRRNRAGIEEFRSYGGLIATKGIETVARLLGTLMIVGGLVLGASYFLAQR
jgi:hypothetical protein